MVDEFTKHGFTCSREGCYVLGSCLDYSGAFDPIQITLEDHTFVLTFHSFANNKDDDICRLTVLPQEEGKNYIVLGNSFMIAFPPTFDFDKDQVSFRVNPNAPPHTEINVIDIRTHHRRRFVVYSFAVVFLIFLVAGIVIVTRKKKEKP